jgi:hypothetical protein
MNFTWLMSVVNFKTLTFVRCSVRAMRRYTVFDFVKIALVKPRQEMSSKSGWERGIQEIISAVSDHEENEGEDTSSDHQGGGLR